jgi:cation-transporting P-type ATPase I
VGALGAALSVLSSGVSSGLTLSATAAHTAAAASTRLPRQLLDLADRERVGGRRASVHGDRAMIEVRGTERGDTQRYARDLVAAIAALPGVAWAGVNAPLGRVVATLRDPATPLADLVEAVDRVERAHLAAHPDGDPPPDASVLDHTGLRRTAGAAAATGLGFALSGVGAVVRHTPLPGELATLVTVVDTQPRLRRAVESVLGRSATDVGLALLSGVAQGLAGNRAALLVDAGQRVSAVVEARAEHAAWITREPDLLAKPELTTAEPVTARRPVPLPPGPVERWADRSGMAGLAAFGLGLPLTGSPRQAVNLALATVPKPARVAQEAFASAVGRVLARRGAVVLDPAVLRRLEWVDTVVLDSDVLVTGELMLGEVVPLGDSGPTEIATALHALFRSRKPTQTRRGDGWELRPLTDADLSGLDSGDGTVGDGTVGDGTVGDGTVGAAAARARERLREAGAVHLLWLTQGGQPRAVASVVEEPSEAIEALAAAAHRSGLRLVIAGSAQPLPRGVAQSVTHAVVPGGERLLGTVRELQVQGSTVLLVSARRAALGNADVGVGVDDPNGTPAWGAQLLVGSDLELAALVIEACGPAARMSRHGVRLAQIGSAMAGIAVLLDRGWGMGSRGAQSASLAVNVASAAALAQGSWMGTQVGRRPLAPPISRVPWHAMPADAVLDRLEVGAEGLSTGQARRRHRAAGTAPPARGLLGGLLEAVVRELDNPLTPILAGGAALSAAVGSVTDAGLVAGVSGLSALVGGVQRVRTDRAVAKLMAGSAVLARVRRDGRWVELPADELVVGDVVELRSGQVVPADCRVLEAQQLQADEASLTGEPFPVTKHPEPVAVASIAERSSMVYEGTSVAAGRGVAVVVATGGSTEVGRSLAATRGAAPPTGVETRLDAITNTTMPLALGAAGAVVAAGLLHRRPLRDSLGAGVSLAVASVPEGLPFLVNAAQLASARRLSRYGALVRNPRTIEALGRVDTLCFDKTGTLTEGRITLAAVDDTVRTGELGSLADEHRAVLAAGLRATPRRRRGQPLEHLTDQAVTEGAEEASVTRQDGLGAWRRLAVLPFEPSLGLHATLADTTGAAGADGSSTERVGERREALLSVKGAPEIVLPRCGHLLRRGKRVAVTGSVRQRLDRRVEELAGQGYRVLAVAERIDLPRRRLAEDEIHDLRLLGFLALADPVRPAAADSVRALRDAGVQIVMITGDHPGTAEAVADRLDVRNGGKVITGPELDELDDGALDELLPHVNVVARGTPAHKVRVVQAFQRLGRTVAMTGDGANDAPAIRLAEVGIALGRKATPAARAAADLVITDERLETILAALVEGRGMWASVREALGILVGGNIGEIAFTVLGAAVSGQSPLNTRQLLLVNLLTDLAPALAIALRPPSSTSAAELLREGPEASLGEALTRDITRRAIVTTGAATAAWTAARFTGRPTRARTVALAALVGTQLGQTLVTGGLSPSVLAAGLGSAAALAAIIQTPGVSQFFGCTPLGPLGWAIAGGAATASTVLAPFVPSSLVPQRLLASGGSTSRPSPT